MSEEHKGKHFREPEAPEHRQASQPSAPVVYGIHEEDRSRRDRQHRHRGRRIAVTIVCVVVALVAVVGVSGYFFYRSAQTVARDAQNVVSAASLLQDALKSGDSEGLQNSAANIAALSTSMSNETEGPLWNVVEVFPVVGEDVSRVRTLVGVVGNLSSDVLTPMANEMSGISMGTLFADGQINVAELTQLCNVVQEVQPAVADAASRVDALGSANLAQVNEPLQKVREELDGLNAAADGLSKVAPSLPAMLGANGARTYLVIAQNNSEIRSTGGFPGSRAIMTIDNGKISLGDFQTVGGHFDDNSIPLTDEEAHVVSDLMQSGAKFAPGDVNAVPSFPRAAQLMEWCWNRSFDQTVDGVLAVDPVFLQSLLALTGGVTTSNGTVVDGTNAAQVLLNQAYYLDPSEQDPFFDEVAGLAIKQVMNSLGSVSLTDLASTMGDGVSAGRLLLYMNDATEEQAITELGADGEVSQDATTPVTGFYVYDKTGSKLDWYLDMRGTVSEPTLNQDGSKSYTVTVTLHNTTTLEQMQNELPAYIVGVTPEVHHYSMITAYLIMAPAGGTITNLDVQSDEVNVEEESTLYGNDVWAGYVNTYPSNTSTFTYTVTTSPDATTGLSLWTTPTGQSFS